MSSVYMWIGFGFIPKKNIEQNYYYCFYLMWVQGDDISGSQRMHVLFESFDRLFNQIEHPATCTYKQKTKQPKQKFFISNKYSYINFILNDFSFIFWMPFFSYLFHCLSPSIALDMDTYILQYYI